MAERKFRVYSRREIEGMIADGRTIFILDQYVVKADFWRPYHPGGDKAILHMVGRDATDEVTAYVLPMPILPTLHWNYSSLTDYFRHVVSIPSKQSSRCTAIELGESREDGTTSSPPSRAATSDRWQTVIMMTSRVIARDAKIRAAQLPVTPLLFLTTSIPLCESGILLADQHHQHRRYLRWSLTMMACRT